MIKRKKIKRYCRQIIAITEKNIYLELRIKSRLIIRFINPIIQLFVLIFIFRLFFTIKQDYSIGYWNADNYILFLLIAFMIQFSKSITLKYQALFMVEKYWKTLSGIMVAPVNRFTILTSVLTSEMIMNSIPLAILFIIAYIFFPIPLIFLIFSLIVFFSIFIVFASIGLIIGAFSISHEEYVSYFNILLRILFLFSCINYPLQIFPTIIRNLILINPLYYMFDLLRLIWYLGFDPGAIKYISVIHFICFFSLTILTPIISLYIFDRVYKKYGITGY